MAVTVLIPTPLRSYVGGRDALELEGGNVGELLCLRRMAACAAS